MSNNIVSISEILEQKIRKEKELEFYEKELLELERKMFWLKKEIQLTNTIIRAIENEEIFDLVKSAESKIPILGKDDNADN
jgi:RNA polymerase-interacting CarD/CdnL/TRCF family regulator